MNMDGPAAKATTIGASIGVTVPTWWPSLDQTSDFAVKMVPILSALWLLLQIVRFVAKWFRGGIGDGEAPQWELAQKPPPVPPVSRSRCR